MRLLFVTQERWYESIVQEIRQKHQADHLFIDTKWEIENGNYHVPKLFGRHIGFRLLASLLTHCLLLTGKYDFCISDYASAFRPFLFCMSKRFADSIRTQFVHDLRTIPVGYPDYRARTIEQKFHRQLRYANEFYQGITLITEEMNRHIEEKYIRITKPMGIWESGVDTSIFEPSAKNITLKRELGFKDSEFVCFYHGVISDTRGIVDLVESFAIIKSREKNIKLLLVGRGHSCERVQKLIDDLGLCNSVKLHDWVEYDRVPEYIALADLCIVPLPDINWWRVSSPLKLMEYIACGKNILLTDMVAHRNVVGRNSKYFWINEITPESLAVQIQEVYRCYRANPNQYYARGLEERERHVDSISWTNRMAALEQFLSGLKDSAC